MVLALGTLGLNAQTTLGAGDLAIAGFNFDNPDDFALVPLVDLASNTEIKVTDNGWLSTGALRSGEGVMVITLNQEISCGTTIFVTNSTVVNAASGVSVGSIVSETTNTFLFSASGDQILLYQGSTASPTFITAINSEGAGVWQANATSSNTSALPAGLTNGVNAVALFEADNGIYDCSTTSDGAANLLAAMCTTGNWNMSNSSVTLPQCGFSVTDCGGGGPEGCGTAFISEYIEGGSFNKCIEIYNPTGSDIDLSTDGYQLKIYFNGSASAGNTINLTGTLAAGDVYVVCDDSAAEAFLAEADLAAGGNFFNGDDAVELVSSSGTLDIFGSIDDDPGSRWQSANGNDTQNQTLVRNSNVYQGITVNPGIAGIGGFTTLETEWTEFGQDVVSDLGSHTFGGCPAPTVCSIDAVEVAVTSGCNDNGTITIADDNANAMVTVYYTDAPSTGSLLIIGDVLGNPSYPAMYLSGGSVSIPVTISADGGPISISAYFSDEPGCALLNGNAATAPEPCSVVPDCSYPFFSEYIEGSGNNKCLEIYNPTMDNLSLAGYRIEIYFNGNTNPGNTIYLPSSASIEPGGVYVVCSPSSDDEFLAIADLATGSTSWFNGDDAVALIGKELSGNYVTYDVIGQIGFDPGSQWNVNGVETQNQTLRRSPWVQAGDNNGINTFDPSAEWIEIDINTEFGLGNHATDCVESDLPIGWNSIQIGCSDGSTVYNPETDEWTLSSDCLNPLSGQDDLSFTFQEKCGDVELSAKFESITGFGKSGLMLRESTDPGSKYVWIHKTGGNTIQWSIRKYNNGAPQVQTQFAFGSSWLKISRSGNIFSGYTSTNGVYWVKKFQSFVYMDECMLAGMAVHSNVDGANTTAIFSNASFGGDEMFSVATGEQEQALGLNRDESSEVELQEFAQDVQINEVTLRPNPVSTWLEVSVPEGFGENVMVSIVDLNGRVLFNEQFSGEYSLLDLDLAAMNLSEGTYLLNLRSETQNVTKRFVKVK
jgi:hypothetical protein